MSFSSSFYVNYGGVGPSLKGQISKRENYFKIGIQWRSLDFGAPLDTPLGSSQVMGI